MKIFTGDKIRSADRYTIEHEPVSSLDLMERAAEVIAQAICQRVEQGSDLLFFIGKGNNGGDGLAVARMLSRVGFHCSVCMVFGADGLSGDCRINYERLPENVEQVDPGDFAVTEETVVIDAMLGSGVSGELRGAALETVDFINSLPCRVISIDVPSGMKTEFGNDPAAIVHAHTTLTIEFPKLAMLLPEAGECCGEIEVLPIDLSPDYIARTESHYYYIEEADVRALLKPRAKFSHKGDYGHALLVCGSRGMAGAAVLSALAALRSGCGLLTVHMPERESTALFANAPSAMLSPDPGDRFSELPADPARYSAIGTGCGLGTENITKEALAVLMQSYARAMVLDADALNLIATNPEMRALVPPGSILTPHPGEFRRLVGEWKDEEEKLGKLRSLAIELHSSVVLKGTYTAICDERGNIFFNPTGSPAMAKGGSGDVLTGFLTGLLARGYISREAAILGVWLHGRAGEKAADYHSAEGMNSADIIDFMGEAWTEIE